VSNRPGGEGGSKGLVFYVYHQVMYSELFSPLIKRVEDSESFEKHDVRSRSAFCKGGAEGGSRLGRQLRYPPSLYLLVAASVHNSILPFGSLMSVTPFQVSNKVISHPVSALVAPEIYCQVLERRVVMNRSGVTSLSVVLMSSLNFSPSFQNLSS
jgi:hypothetical protein